uniref:MalT-like TPR region domain-containing protein n=1 Tax=Leersia perrieri TaxID=77586 RepID=A0A0D9VPL2_9ORYZ
MRRIPKSLLLASLSSNPFPRRNPLPLPLLRPPPNPLPRVLPPFAAAARTLTAPVAPPEPAAVAAAAVKPDGIELLEAAEQREAASDHQEAFGLAIKALEPLQASHGGWSLPVVRTLRLAGAAATRLGRLSDGLESLNAAAEIIDSLESVDKEVAAVGAAVHEQLARTKTAMGRRWDAVPELMRALELKAILLEEGSLELGNAYKDVAEAYTGVLCFEKALPLCLKALEISENQFGGESPEVAKIRQLLATVYAGLGRNEEALEQNEIVRMVYEKLGLDVELSLAENDVANMLILLGRSEEAMDVLKRVIKRASKESEERALAFVAMAKILCFQDKSADSKRCLEIAREILDSKVSVSPVRVAQVYAEVSMLYESLTEFEVALCLMKKTLMFLDGVSEMQQMQGSLSSRMGWLLLVTERVDEAVPYLESAVEKLKNCFGPLHFGLGFSYKHLGEAYLAMNQTESAVKYLTIARDIINSAFGPKHEDSIEAIQSLANAYGVMGSYKRAMECQEQVIDAYRSCGPGALDDLKEAHRLRHQLKMKAQGLPHAVFPANSLPVIRSRE